ncbi:hypothetical protein MN116_008262 [Schistosoma mekongi]|uniref:Uncharacterized protein n=1 Tax=Schistosoma mekongi TaxID=38744 RepID=A0AAE1Z6B8_SCHME|nr:hypothetical protein MN116_008262 [Schistosoma mekongi]
MTRKSERVSVDEDEEEDIYDPKSRGFCRACVDLTKFGLLRTKELTSKSGVVKGIKFIEVDVVLKFTRNQIICEGGCFNDLLDIYDQVL